MLFLMLTVMSGVNANAGNVERIASKTIERWNYALKSGHMDAIMRFYAQDAVLVQSNGDFAGDVDQIRSFWKDLVKNPGAYELNLQEAHRDGDNIVLTARLDVVATGQKLSKHPMNTRYEGTIQQVIKHQGRGWKTIVQQWNE